MHLKLLTILKMLLSISIPVLSCLFILLISVVPQPLTDSAIISIQMTHTAVFYWSIYTPKEIPNFVLFALGILQDILLGLPLGISSFSFICIHFFVTYKNDYFIGKSFFHHWLIFSFIFMALTLLNWLIMMAINGLMFNPLPIVFQYIITVSFYPCAAWLFGKLKKIKYNRLS